MRWLVALLWCVAPAAAEPLELTQAQPLRGITQLALGAQHSCGRRADGSVVCWGLNEEGQLGDGRTFKNLVQLAAGSLYTCARTTTEVWCWGANNVYQLGVGDATNPKATLSGGFYMQTGRSRRFGKPIAIALGDVSYAIDAAGAVTCVGHSNFCGWEIGTSKVLLPPVSSIAVGDGHACAVTRAGEVYCWGRTDWGQGGAGLDHTDQQPTKVDGLSDIVEIGAGGAHTCARTKTGGVYCWGDNDHGQLGDGTTKQRNRPVKLDLAHVEQLALGGFGSCVRFTGGTVSCWGAHLDVPNIDYSKGGRTLVPTKLALTGVLELVAGGAHVCARLDDDTVRCWGLNSDGQLGDGSHNYSAVPVTVTRTSRTDNR